MGYELHITRAPDWFDSPLQPISQQEWEAYARRHRHLREDGTIAWADFGVQPLFTYTASDDTDISLSWYESRIEVAGILDDSVVPDIVQIAKDIGAGLVGDEGERYTSSNPHDQQPDTTSRAAGFGLRAWLCREHW